MLLTENSAAAVKTKRGAALVYRRMGALVFMYLPMLDNIGNIPNDIYTLDESAADLPGLLSSLAVKLFPKGRISSSSFARICSIASTLAFSEDTVKYELDGDGLIDVEKAFYAFGKAIGGLDPADATELSEPPVTVSFSCDSLSVLLYGYEIYKERSAVLAAVTPYSFTEKEYSAAFVLALMISIFKSRK